MKVRDEPVTPWTMAILPARRLDSCARKSVGRRSFISRSLRKPGAELPLASAFRIPESTDKVAFAATGGDDHVHPPQDIRVAFDTGGIERQSCGVGSDALPGFHLALIALFRDLRVEADRRQRMNDIGREVLLIGIDTPLVQRVPMRIKAFTE